METLYLSANAPNTAAIAAQIIKSGGLVALPTETVYGLGANGLSPEAVDKIFVAKGRPNDNPLILHICDASQMASLCHSIPESAWALAAAFWPGPLTMVLPAKAVVPKRTTGGLSTVAVRCPDSDITRQVIRLSGVPIAAPSANISGKPSTTTADHVRHDHHGRIDCIIDGGPCRVGVESTIVDLTATPPRLLRPGGITLEQLTEVLGQVAVDEAITRSLGADEIARAPGMKYRHYAPQCQVVIVEGSREAAARWIHARWQPGDRVLCFQEELELYGSCSPLSYGRESEPETLSAGLFDALRQLDDPAVTTVFARCPAGTGIGLAVRNRLSKAAAFHSVDAQTSFVIGITGGTGCGKTTLLSCVETLGGTVIDCDRVYHDLLKTDESLLQAIEARFPGTVCGGRLDRKALGAIVFADEAALGDLNAITHSAVTAQVRKLLRSQSGLVAIDAIGLFESGLVSLCDTTVAVTAPEEARLSRLMARDGIDEAYAKARIAAQKDNAYFSTLCRHTLENDGSAADFQQKCLAFLRGLGIMEA